MDEGYAVTKLRVALKAEGKWTVEIIRRSDKAEGFVLLQRRWIVEQTFAKLGLCRRLAEDWEKTVGSSNVWAMVVSMRSLTGKIAKRYVQK